MANQVPATQLDTKEIIYKAADGSEVKLTPDMVKKYLVQGNGELVTMQEMIYFLNICRSRKLNPLIKDCYLIKYSQDDPAAIVTSVDYFRKRARAMPDCQGWRSGIIVRTAEGEIKDTSGLIIDGETLLGGWFEAQPTGWVAPMRLEVNLKGYVKKKKDGTVTRFWSPDNQPTQIQKVAESQGLRKLWPDLFQGLYTEEEISEEDRKQAVDIGGAELKESEKKAIPSPKPASVVDAAKNFVKAIPQDTDKKLLDAYLKVCAEHFKKPIDEVKAGALADMTAFLDSFNKWAKIQTQKAAVTGGEKKEGDVPEPDELAPGPCPNDQKTTYNKKFCENMCKAREGCPVYEG